MHARKITSITNRGTQPQMSSIFQLRFSALLRLSSHSHPMTEESETRVELGAHFSRASACRIYLLCAMIDPFYIFSFDVIGRSNTQGQEQVTSEKGTKENEDRLEKKSDGSGLLVTLMLVLMLSKEQS